MPWYYYRSGRREGPIDDAVFRRMAADGQLELTDLVWSPGMKEWAQVTTVSGLLVPPPLPLQGRTEEKKFVLGDSPVVPVPSPPPVSAVSSPVPQNRGTSTGQKSPERSLTRAAISSPLVQGEELKKPIPVSKDGKCPKCATSLPETALFVKDYRCPGCGTPLALASNKAVQKSDDDEDKQASMATPGEGPAKEDILQQTPQMAYVVAIIVGTLGPVAVSLPFLAEGEGVFDIDSSKIGVVIGTALCYAFVGWLLGLKYPTPGWQWGLWLAGPLFAFTLLAEVAIAERFWMVSRVVFACFLPAVLGALVGSGQGMWKRRYLSNVEEWGSPGTRPKAIPYVVSGSTPAAQPYVGTQQEKLQCPVCGESFDNVGVDPTPECPRCGASVDQASAPQVTTQPTVVVPHAGKPIRSPVVIVGTVAFVALLLSVMAWLGDSLSSRQKDYVSTTRVVQTAPNVRQGEGFGRQEAPPLPKTVPGKPTAPAREPFRIEQAAGDISQVTTGTPGPRRSEESLANQVASPAGPARSRSARPSLVLLSWQLRRGEGEYTFAVGSVLNTSEETLTGTRVVVSYFLADGTPLEPLKGPLGRGPVAPGQRTYFYIPVPPGWPMVGRGRISFEDASGRVVPFEER